MTVSLAPQRTAANSGAAPEACETLPEYLAAHGLTEQFEALLRRHLKTPELRDGFRMEIDSLRRGSSIERPTEQFLCVHGVTARLTSDLQELVGTPWFEPRVALTDARAEVSKRDGADVVRRDDLHLVQAVGEGGAGKQPNR